MITNRQAGIEFKRRVMLYLLQRGIAVADPMDNQTRLSELVGIIRTAGCSGIS